MSKWQLTICFFFFVILVSLHVWILVDQRRIVSRIEYLERHVSAIDSSQYTQPGFARWVVTKLDDLDKRVQAIERSVDIMPGNNPTEKNP